MDVVIGVYIAGAIVAALICLVNEHTCYDPGEVFGRMLSFGLLWPLWTLRMFCGATRRIWNHE